MSNFSDVQSLLKNMEDLCDSASLILDQVMALRNDKLYTYSSSISSSINKIKIEIGIAKVKSLRANKFELIPVNVNLSIITQE